MPHNFVADSFRTKKQTSFKRSAILHRKRPFCVFEPLWGLSGNVRWSC